MSGTRLMEQAGMRVSSEDPEGEIVNALLAAETMEGHKGEVYALTGASLLGALGH